MHGLINRSIQRFVASTYGGEIWDRVAEEADLGFTDFEAMLSYDRVYTPILLDAITRVLERPLRSIMEDIGTFLVTHPDFEAVRRLLRFSGVSFVDFLHSLDDLADRARLAVPDLELPSLELHEHSPTDFRLRCSCELPGYGHFMLGILQVMADDYGALAVLEHKGRDGTEEEVAIAIFAEDFAKGRRFDLGCRTG